MNLKTYLMIKQAVLYNKTPEELNNQLANNVLPENVNPEYAAELQKLKDEWDKKAPVLEYANADDPEMVLADKRAYMDALAKHKAEKQKVLDALNAKYGIK